MIGTVQWTSRPFAAIATLSILALMLSACGLISEAKLEIPVKPTQAGLVNPCAAATIDEMGFTPRVTPGPSPTAIRISASDHPDVISSTPALMIDVTADGSTKPVQVTVKAIGGPIPVSVSVLEEKTEKFASLFRACMD